MTSCIKQNTKKYKLRDSPPYSAMDCKNSIQKGNDGLEYVSKPNKIGNFLLFDMPKFKTVTFAKYKHPHCLPHVLVALFFVLIPYNLIPIMNECLIRFDSTFIIYKFYKNIVTPFFLIFIYTFTHYKRLLFTLWFDVVCVIKL